ncbi:PBSX family phage terminase large subunit, partial [bacterium]|nr:PBSX family phage terminase large subunit [bacterium]
MANFLNINDLYYPLLEDQSRYEILYGGADSGKSHFAAQKIITRCLKESNHRVLLVRKVQHTIRHSQFQIIKDIIIQAGLLGSFTLVPSNLRIDGPNNCEIIGAGIDDPEKLKSIHGITIVWIEEATELLQEDFEELDRRVRGVKEFYKQIMMSFNPINDAHWLNHTFFLDLPPKQHCIQSSEHRGMSVTICQSNFEVNKYVDPLDAQRYGTFTGNTAIVYTVGLWGGKTDPDQIISHEMIQQAFMVEPVEGSMKLGCDIARYGDDKTVLTLINGNFVSNIWVYDQMDTNRTSNIVKNIAIEQIIDADKVGVDGTGLGAGVGDNLIAYGMKVKDIIAGAKPVIGAFDDRTMHHAGYINLRAQMYFYARKCFTDGLISFPEKTTHIKFLIGDLTTARY